MRIFFNKNSLINIQIEMLSRVGISLRKRLTRGMSSPNLPEIEERVLKFWKEERSFEK